MFDSGELRLVLLKLIADQPRHGYDLIRAIEELTHGAYAPSPGVVYPTLTMLQDMGLIEEAKGEGRARPSRSPLTARTISPRRKRRSRICSGGSRRSAATSARPAAPPIKRAVGNLLSSIWHRVTREDMDEGTMHKIAAILDEAAQKIEQLK